MAKATVVARSLSRRWLWSSHQVELSMLLPPALVFVKNLYRTVVSGDHQDVFERVAKLRCDVIEEPTAVNVSSALDALARCALLRDRPSPPPATPRGRRPRRRRSCDRRPRLAAGACSPLLASRRAVTEVDQERPRSARSERDYVFIRCALCKRSRLEIHERVPRGSDSSSADELDTNEPARGERSRRPPPRLCADQDKQSASVASMRLRVLRRERKWGERQPGSVWLALRAWRADGRWKPDVDDRTRQTGDSGTPRP